MLDPLTSIGLVANVAQLLSFTTAVVKEARNLVQSSSDGPPSCEDIAELVRLQERSCLRLSQTAITETSNGSSEVNGLSSAQSEAEGEIKKLAESIAGEAKALVAILASLAVQPRQDGSKPMVPALWSVTKAKFKKSEITQRQRNIERYQLSLHNTLLGSIKESQTNEFLHSRQQMQRLWTENKQIVSDASNALLRALEDQGSQSKGLLKELERISSVTMKHSDETSAALYARAVDDDVDAGNEMIFETEESLLRRRHQRLANKTHAKGKQKVSKTNAPNWSHSSPHNKTKTQFAHPLDFSMRTKVGSSDLAGREDELDDELKVEKQTMKYILRSISFPEMPMRRHAIPIAHNTTFQWIFEESAKSPFQDWLASPRPLFWVNGKAGSGKSTLMKFLMSSPQTSDLLRKWAGTLYFTKVEFYFWYLGSQLQKSEEGLLRGMLYQILQASPALFPIAIPERWSIFDEAMEALPKWNEVDYEEATRAPWTLDELMTAMQNIARCTSDHRFCFFIDGLDEYDADQSHLVHLIQEFSKNPEFKFCVSSRPENVFRKAFDEQPDMFVLEELTRSDIAHFVTDKLGRKVDAVEVQALVYDIIAKAQGVFLWVHITVQDLLEGLAEGDSVRVLKARVERLPSELGTYFTHILARVHPVYRDTGLTMSAFQLAMRAAGHELNGVNGRESVAVHAHSFMNLWLLKEGLDDSQFAITRQVMSIGKEDCLRMVRETRQFTSACSKGLLCIPAPTLNFQVGQRTYMTQFKVDFLHRTVYEFLRLNEIRRRIELEAIPRLADDDFETMIALARLKLFPMNSQGRCRFLAETIEEFERPHTPHDRLRLPVYVELDRTAAHYIRNCTGPCGNHEAKVVLQILLGKRCYHYATAVLRKVSMIAQADFDKPRQPLLRTGLGFEGVKRVFKADEIDVGFLDAYLAAGVNVSARDEVDESSPWELFLGAWVEAKNTDLDSNKMWEIAKVFVKHGADTRGRIRGFVGQPAFFDERPPVLKLLAEKVPAHLRDEMSSIVARGQVLKGRDMHHCQEEKSPATVTVTEDSEDEIDRFYHRNKKLDVNSHLM